MSKEKQKEMAQFVAYRKSAEKGDPSAQMMVGTFFANGKGVPRDLEEAAVWYHKAADAGHASAQVLLGTCYAYGNGVPKDAFKAAEYFRKAALAGNRMGQYRLGECYTRGTGVPRDEEQAKQWYRKAADQGLGLAKNRLRTLEAKEGKSQPVRSTFRSSSNLRTQQPKGGGQPKDTGKTTQEDLLGKQAEELKSRGDLNGALRLYKEQEKILKEKHELKALKINLIQQTFIMKELLKEIDSEIQTRLENKD